ncbi:MAG: DUF4851 domain-containing protein [Desulfovibrionaceae bacterium]|nr:DUF4851 domain-containing protein [Desulfovibrionaceae bacterium]
MYQCKHKTRHLRTKTIFFLLLSCLVLIISGCLRGEQRGVSGQNYISTARPPLEISAPSLQLLGSSPANIKLPGMGMIGGVPLRTHITYYGSKDGPKLLIAHAELPSGWIWDANPWQSFSVNKIEEGIGGINFAAQTFLTIPYKNPLATDAESQMAKEQKTNDRWIVRNFSRRFNNDRHKIIIEYREKLSSDIDNLNAMPYGSANLLSEFENRARKAFTITAPTLNDAKLQQIPLPDIRLRYLDEHFFGSATPINTWPYR